MIEQLHIRNFAIIDDLNLNFKPGLTVITGETGSGKSIILQALAVSLGMKPTRTMVKTGSDRSTVETRVVAKEEHSVFYRVIALQGRNKNYLDDEPVAESVLKDKAQLVADFHGQHEQQQIVNRNTHINYLDNYAGIGNDVEKLGELFHSLERCKTELDELKQKLLHARERAQLLEFQLNEIAAIAPRLNEDSELEVEFRRLSHAEDVIGTIDAINEQISQGERPLVATLNNMIKELGRLVKYDTELDQYSKALSEALIILQDSAGGLRIHSQELEFDDERLRELQERLQALEMLKRKYGGSLEAVIEFQDTNQAELEDLSHLENRIKTNTKKIKELQQEFQVQADKMHAIRMEMAPKLATAIEQEMQKLNMPGGRFTIQITQNSEPGSIIYCDDQPVRLGAAGYDQIQFFLSANPGEKLKPLDQIASGGEISRIMLAIKTVLQASDPVEVLIFDEIDTGISGEAAEKVAESLVNLARDKQVICITHLPQIARRADHHLQVEKRVTTSATQVTTRYLTGDESQLAIAKLTANPEVHTMSLAADG